MKTAPGVALCPSKTTQAASMPTAFDKVKLLVRAPTACVAGLRSGLRAGERAGERSAETKRGRQVGVEPEPNSVIDELDQACSLSKKQVRCPAPGAVLRDPRVPTRVALRHEASPFCSHCPRQRLIGFAVCFSIGMILNIVVRPCPASCLALWRGLCSSRVFVCLNCLGPPPGLVPHLRASLLRRRLHLRQHHLPVQARAHTRLASTRGLRLTRPHNTAPASCAAPRSSSRT